MGKGQLIERQAFVTWYTPAEKLPPVGQIVVVSISGFSRHTTYDHNFALAKWYSDDFGWVLSEDTDVVEFVVHAWCDLEPYGGRSHV